MNFAFSSIVGAGIGAGTVAVKNYALPAAAFLGENLGGMLSQQSLDRSAQYFVLAMDGATLGLGAVVGATIGLFHGVLANPPKNTTQLEKFFMFGVVSALAGTITFVGLTTLGFASAQTAAVLIGTNISVRLLLKLCVIFEETIIQGGIGAAWGAANIALISHGLNVLSFFSDYVVWAFSDVAAKDVVIGAINSMSSTPFSTGAAIGATVLVVKSLVDPFFNYLASKITDDKKKAALITELAGTSVVITGVAASCSLGLVTYGANVPNLAFTFTAIAISGTALGFSFVYKVVKQLD